MCWQGHTQAYPDLNGIPAANVTYFRGSLDTRRTVALVGSAAPRALASPGGTPPRPAPAPAPGTACTAPVAPTPRDIEEAAMTLNYRRAHHIQKVKSTGRDGRYIPDTCVLHVMPYSIYLIMLYPYPYGGGAACERAHHLGALRQGLEEEGRRVVPTLLAQQCQRCGTARATSGADSIHWSGRFGGASMWACGLPHNYGQGSGCGGGGPQEVERPHKLGRFQRCSIT
jgi:hypothetical protein